MPSMDAGPLPEWSEATLGRVCSHFADIRSLLASVDRVALADRLRDLVRSGETPSAGLVKEIDEGLRAAHDPLGLSGLVRAMPLGLSTPQPAEIVFVCPRERRCHRSVNPVPGSTEVPKCSIDDVDLRTELLR